MSEIPLSFMVDETLKKDFTRLAQRHNTTADALLRQFMRDCLADNHLLASPFPPPGCTEEDYAQWFRQQVQIGLEQANAGKVISHAEVEARFAAKCAALRRKIGAEE